LREACHERICLSSRRQSEKTRIECKKGKVPINLTDQAKQIQERMGKENRQKKERNRKKEKEE